VCVGGGRGSITFPKVDLQTEMTRASSRHNQVAPENNNEEGAVDRDGGHGDAAAAAAAAPPSEVWVDVRHCLPAYLPACLSKH
jgi:hypothetical protein